mgnify:CR=1 FL=1
MTPIKQTFKRYNLDIQSPAIGLMALGTFLCGINLTLISTNLGPISNQARIWNDCVNTTQDFLYGLPNFVATDDSELKAMAVNLCNGSTPQEVERP